MAKMQSRNFKTKSAWHYIKSLAVCAALLTAVAHADNTSAPTKDLSIQPVPIPVQPLPSTPTTPLPPGTLPVTPKPLYKPNRIITRDHDNNYFYITEPLRLQFDDSQDQALKSTT